MPFTKKLQKFNATVRSVEVGTGDKAVTLGGGNTLPFYSFDAPTTNTAKIGIEISDMGLAHEPDCIKEVYAGCETVADMAKKAITMEGVDFLCLRLEGGDPNGENRPVEELVAVAKEVAEAVDFPLVVEGCKNVEKDAELLSKVAEALQGKNVLLMSAKEENYKNIGAAAGLAYNQLVGAESAVDINLAKQLNVLLKQLGVDSGKVIMNVGSSAAGYGFDYLISTLDRVKAAALGQNDDSLLMPIITPVASETWSVKESVATEEDAPGWGCVVERAIDMEVETAVACLACGSDAVILKHPTSVATVSKLISALS
ncbi:MAG: acetyl-CoA decarbonylase/synthase complex subunit delta [Lachnospiraceae bacterium]|nr:acetyl-CoA decarbonylase/synthase complex subunit delta [Lachnospiraceae bacterium]